MQSMIPLVIDTNVLVGALLGGGGASRRVVRACLSGIYQPLMGVALFSEYEDVFSREPVWQNALLNARERREVFDGFLNACRWIEVFFAWRPNLPDEADNHLMELAVAGNALAIVTGNVRDLARGELRFPSQPFASQPTITPEQCLEAFPCPP